MALKLAILITIATFCSGFVLLSGPQEATLEATIESPNVTFNVTGNFPVFDDKDKFLDGRYAALSDQDYWIQIIQEAIKSWNNVEGSWINITLNTSPAAEPSQDSEDGIHSIVIASLNATSAAAAYPKIENGKIIDCDILIGDQLKSSKDMAYALLHEMGHCLGLGHNHSHWQSVMGYSRSNRSLSLAADDMAGLIYLYPDESASMPKELVSCGAVVGKKTNTAGLIWLLPLMTIALITIKNRFRSKSP